MNAMQGWAVRDTTTGTVYPQPNKLIAAKVAEMHGQCEVIPTEPPTDDEREAVIAVIGNAYDSWPTLVGNHAHRTREARDECMAGRCDRDIRPNGYSFKGHAPSRAEHVADTLIASAPWRNRGRGPLTEMSPTVEAAARAMYRMTASLSMAGAKTLAKAALEAAREAEVGR